MVKILSFWFTDCKYFYQQRPPFFSFKMGFPSATTLASKLSAATFLFSAVLMVLLPDQLKRNVTVRKFIANQATLFFGSFAVFLSWELTHHLHRVSSLCIHCAFGLITNINYVFGIIISCLISLTILYSTISWRMTIITTRVRSCILTICTLN